ncbi:hypothetical protein C1632_09055 [Microbacterium testaceum]|nr:hypothetical protein C1632_09055 [Microbacterium testaceum]
MARPRGPTAGHHGPAPRPGTTAGHPGPAPRSYGPAPRPYGPAPRPHGPASPAVVRSSRPMRCSGGRGHGVSGRSSA